MSEFRYLDSDDEFWKAFCRHNILGCAKTPSTAHWLRNMKSRFSHQRLLGQAAARAFLQQACSHLPPGTSLCCVGRLQPPHPPSPQHPPSPHRSLLLIGRFDGTAPCPLLLASHLDLDPLLQRLSSILDDSHASMQGVDDSQAAKVVWWKRRLQLDGRVDALLKDMQQQMGVAGCVLIVHPTDHHVVACGWCMPTTQRERIDQSKQSIAV